jgi:ABC-type sugar transport system permease subunit
MIGGYSAFIALIAFRRRSKGKPIFDFAFTLMLACVVILIALQFAWILRS